MKYRHLKGYHGIIVLVLSAAVIFGIAPIFGAGLGIYGSLLGELMILAVAVVTVLAARADLKEVFPIHRPKALGLLGTLLIWGATYVCVMALTMLLAYFFPEEVTGAGARLSEAILNTPMLIAAAIVAVSPAICEEAVFRGVFLHSLQGIRQKWLVILLVGVIFGAFHGSIWKLLPTSVLGMVMTYIVLETDNLVYSGFLHFVNNLLPVLMMGALSSTYEAMGGIDAVMEESMQIPMASVGIYFLMAAGAPLVFYIGRYCLKRSVHGYTEGLFTKNQVKPVLLLIFIGILIGIAGVFLIACSFIFEMPGNLSGFREIQSLY